MFDNISISDFVYNNIEDNSNSNIYDVNGKLVHYEKINNSKTITVNTLQFTNLFLVLLLYRNYTSLIIYN